MFFILGDTDLPVDASFSELEKEPARVCARLGISTFIFVVSYSILLMLIHNKLYNDFTSLPEKYDCGFFFFLGKPCSCTPSFFFLPATTNFWLFLSFAKSANG